jgi:hypothetical protein
MSEALLRRELRILIDPELLDPSIEHFAERMRLLELDRMLHQLQSLQTPPCKITLLTLDATASAREIRRTDSMPFTFYKSPNHNAAVSEKAARDGDADIVSVLAANRPASDQPPVLILDAVETVAEARIFLQGHGVPWERERGVVPFSVLYAVSEPVVADLRQLHTRLAGLAIDVRTIESARSLAYNRTSNICFTRDRLQFYGMQRRMAARRAPQELHYAMEVGYFLSHYYLLICGAFDQLCRIAAPVFETGIDPDDWRKIGVRKKSFLAALAASAPDVHELFVRPKFIEWFDMLSTARHFVAHQGQASSTPLLRQPDSELTDYDLDRQLMAEGGWNELLEDLPADLADEARRTLRFELRVRSYEQVADDTMVFTTRDGTLLIRPLANVRADFEMFSGFAKDLADLCATRLKA